MMSVPLPRPITPRHLPSIKWGGGLAGWETSAHHNKQTTMAEGEAVARQRAFDGRIDGWRQGGGLATVAKVVLDGDGGGGDGGGGGHLTSALDN